MNLIHNKLYLDHSTTQIEMQEYLTKLLHHIKDAFGGEKERNISLRIDVWPVMLDADKAVAIGLIVNELATNAFKYAFDGGGGEIYLCLKQESKSKLLFSLRDNGKGISDVHKKNGASFGIKLVNLMARQLNSTLIVKNDKGAFYQMEIGI
jgi:two-component sensor histidine kinase